MNKAERLKLLRKIDKKYREKEELIFAGLPVSNHDIREMLQDMDSFREERRQNRGEALTSDEV